MYVEGVNSPFHWLGGGWELPGCPPAHLRGLFADEGAAPLENSDEEIRYKNEHDHTTATGKSKSHRELSSYSHFADTVNAAVQWDMGGWEVCYYYFLLLAAPPRAERFLVSV
jgi:hypothetical protein